MVLSLQQNTQILHYLQHRNLDRLILNDFNDTQTITNTNNNLNINPINGTIHNNSFEISNTTDVIFKFDKILFNKFEELRILIETDENIDDIECFLSVANNAQIRNINLDIHESIESIENFHEIVFTIPIDEKYKNTLSNIQSLILVFKDEISLKIHNISINTNNYDTSLEMFETSYKESKNYISEWLTTDQLKLVVVENAIIKLASINLWLVEFQKDSKQHSGYMGTKNYYDQLLIQVENTIRKFNPDFNKESEDTDTSKSKINENLIGSI